MVDKFIDVDLTNPDSEGLKVLSNLLDPVNLSIFVDRVKDSSTDKSFEDLVDDLMEGR